MACWLCLLPAVLHAQNNEWEVLITEGQRALQQRDYVGAEQRFEAALELAEGFPAEDPRLGKSLNNLAAVYYAQEDFDRAEPLMRQSLASLREVLGPSHPDVAQTLKNLAALYFLQQRYEQAEPLLREALAILENATGPNDPNTAPVLANLARLYQAQGKNAQAEPLLERALALYEESLGADHPEVERGRALLAELKQANGVSDQSPPATVANVPEPAPPPPRPKPAIPALAPSGENGATVAQDRPEPALGRPAPEPTSDVAEPAGRPLSVAALPDAAATPGAVAPPAPPPAENGANLVRRALANLPEPAGSPAAAADAPSGASSEPAVVRPGDIVIHLTTIWSQPAAEQEWAALQQRFPEVLGPQRLALQQIATDGQGSFFRVLTGPFDDEGAAETACRSLQFENQTQFCEIGYR